MFLTATKNQEMCNKATENYPSALEYVPECYKAQRKYVIKLLTLIRQQ